MMFLKAAPNIHHIYVYVFVCAKTTIDPTYKPNNSNQIPMSQAGSQAATTIGDISTQRIPEKQMTWRIIPEIDVTTPTLLLCVCVCLCVTGFYASTRAVAHGIGTRFNGYTYVRTIRTANMFQCLASSPYCYSMHTQYNTPNTQWTVCVCAKTCVYAKDRASARQRYAHTCEYRTQSKWIFFSVRFHMRPRSHRGW